MTHSFASNVSKYLLSVPALNTWTLFEHGFTLWPAWTSNALGMNCRMNLDYLTEGLDEEEWKAENLVTFY